jgi:hypothetical protein
MASFVRLDVRGHGGEQVPNTLVVPMGRIGQLCILLPGAAYTCDAPLFFYPTQLMVERGVDVFRVEYFFGHGRGVDEEKLFADVSAATNAVLDRASYDRVTVIGKSLGTLAMTHVFDIEPRLRGAGAVWLTPLLADRRLHAHRASPDRASLIVMGTRDPQYDADHLARLRAAGHRTLVLENANHSLGVEGDLVRTLEMLQKTVEAVGEFLDRS